MKRLAFVLLVTVLFSACKNSGDGQLVGVDNRPEFLDLAPFGMVYIPAGNYTMGAGDQDVPFATTNQSKSVTVSAIWMDETEITNNEY
ncbi:MAG: gliding motility-associated lipoprotein, partial [Bacteroidetes bacterium HGW-Bacteroidetes-19]